MKAAQAHIQVLPSLLCTDPLSLRENAKKLVAGGYPVLHADIIDPSFAPETPLNTALVKNLADSGIVKLDLHLMATRNLPILEHLLGNGIASASFHWETELHPDLLLQMIRDSGASPGIALSPETPVEQLGYALERCDYLLLMLINPGYAGSPTERMVPYAMRKVRETRQWLDKNGFSNIRIEVDGRVTTESIPELIRNGATDFVAGTRSLFKSGLTFSEASLSIAQAILSCQTEGEVLYE